MSTAGDNIVSLLLFFLCACVCAVVCSGTNWTSRSRQSITRWRERRGRGTCRCTPAGRHVTTMQRTRRGGRRESPNRQRTATRLRVTRVRAGGHIVAGWQDMCMHTSFLVVGYNVCLCLSVCDIMCVYSFTACFLIIVMFRKSVCGLALVVRPHGHFNCMLSVCVCIYMRSRLSLCCLYSIIACYSGGGSSCQ